VFWFDRRRKQLDGYIMSNSESDIVFPASRPVEWRQADAMALAAASKALSERCGNGYISGKIQVFVVTVTK
jgi:hypothetical protein